MSIEVHSVASSKAKFPFYGDSRDKSVSFHRKIFELSANKFLRTIYS